MPSVIEERRREPKLQVFAGRNMYQRVCDESIRRLPTNLQKKIKLNPFDRLGKKAKSTEGEIVLAVYALSQLSGNETIRLGRNSRHVIFVEEMPVEALADKLVKLNVKSGRRLHIAHETDYEDVAGVVFRVLAGSLDIQECRIVDAWGEDGNLVLLSPSFKRLCVPMTLLHRLLGDDEEEIRAFEIDEDGSYLYWPHADVHMGWEQFQFLLDPQVQLRQKQRELKGYNERYGAAIRTLRKQHELTQSDIKGIDPRTLGRVERGEASASAKTLSALAVAHDMSLNDYMKAVATHLN